MLEHSPEEYTPERPTTRKSAASGSKLPIPQSDNFSSQKHQNNGVTAPRRQPTATINDNGNITEKGTSVNTSSSESTSPLAENIRDDNSQTTMKTRHTNGGSQKVSSPHKTRSVTALEVRHREPEQSHSQISKAMQVITRSPFLAVNGNEMFPSNYSTPDLHPLVVENRELKEKYVITFLLYLY